MGWNARRLTVTSCTLGRCGRPSAPSWWRSTWFSVPNRPADEEWFDAEARAEWQRVVPGLERLDLLKPEDRAMLVVFCTTWSR